MRFKSALMSEYATATDDYSTWECCNGTDQGGDAEGADPFPPGDGPGHRNARKAAKRRQNHTYKLIFRHISDIRLRELLNELEGDTIGRDAWKLIVRECQEQITDLEVMQYKNITLAITARIGIVGVATAHSAADF